MELNCVIDGQFTTFLCYLGPLFVAWDIIKEPYSVYQRQYRNKCCEL